MNTLPYLESAGSLNCQCMQYDSGDVGSKHCSDT